MAFTTDAFEIDGFVQQRKELEALLMSNPQMEKKVQGLIRKVLMQARKQIGEAASHAMKEDPRQAYKAVKTAVYRQILGGNASIYRKKRASKSGGSYEPERTLRPGQRGGNRKPRSGRTQQLQSYMGSDRGFILRFLNQGTGDRSIHSMGNRALQTGSVSILKTKSLGGNRGSITARNWFGGASHKELENVAGRLQEIIDKVINEEFK